MPLLRLEKAEKAYEDLCPLCWQPLRTRGLPLHFFVLSSVKDKDKEMCYSCYTKRAEQRKRA